MSCSKPDLIIIVIYSRLTVERVVCVYYLIVVLQMVVFFFNYLYQAYNSIDTKILMLIFVEFPMLISITF